MELTPESEEMLMMNATYLTEDDGYEVKSKPNKHKRRSLSLGEKLSIIEEIEGGKNKNRVADDRQLPRSTVCSIWDARRKIKTANAVHGRHDGCKRLRSSGYDEVDQALYRWWLHASDKGMPINTNILLEKARTFAQSLGVKFKNAVSWMDRFKARHGMKKNRRTASHHESDDPLVRRDEFVKELPSLTSSRNYKDIYCVNQVGLLYHVLPDVDQIIGDSHNVCSDKRVTIMLGANMDGSDILPPLVIGNAPDIQNITSLESLSVNYYYNKSSLMTALIWREWIKAFDKSMRFFQRHVILFSDGSPSNFVVSDLKNVTVKFVPERSTAFMPSKQGIMQRFKLWYRKLVLRDMVESMNDGMEFRMDMLSGLHFVRKAWEHISQDCVLNSFKVAGWTWDENYADNHNFSDPLPSLTNECYKLNISETVFAEIDKVEECMKTQEELTDQVILDSVTAQQALQRLNTIEEEMGEEEEPEVETVHNKNISISNGDNSNNDCHTVPNGLADSSNSKPDLSEAKNAMKTLHAFLESFEEESKQKMSESKRKGRPKKRVEKKFVQKGKVMSLNPEKGVFEMTMTKIIKTESDESLHMECSSEIQTNDNDGVYVPI